MTTPKFTGPYAELAAQRWARLHLARELLGQIPAVAQRLLIGSVNVETLTETVVDGQIINDAKYSPQANDEFQPNGIKLNEKQMRYVDELINIVGINNELAMSLVNKYDNLNNIVMAELDDIANMTYLDKNKGKQVGTRAAKNIIRTVSEYLEDQ